jgi:UDP-N-acetylglucosamine 2-epimerase (non-hydrolysing)
MKKIAIVIGTRPEAIKLCPFINCIKNEFSEIFSPLVISTGQHKEILDDVFNLFNVIPDFRLDIDRTNSTLSSLQSQLVQSLESIFIQETPDIVAVQGDTHSTLSGAMAAFYQKIPIAYIESGLRSGNLYEPFPEEANRKMVTQLTTWHFTPTIKASEALKSEGIVEQVYEVGNTVIDALMMVKKVDDSSSEDGHGYLKRKREGRNMVLITVHRRENWGEGINNVMLAVKKLLGMYDNLDIVWLTHPNPTIKQQVQDMLGTTDHVYIYPPANYKELVQLMGESSIILTDSGGIQEEAPSLNKPVLVAREVTERMEGVDAGCAKLVGVNTDVIVKSIRDLLDSTENYNEMIHVKNPYGDGTTSQQILTILAS